MEYCSATRRNNTLFLAERKKPVSNGFIWYDSSSIKFLNKTTRMEDKSVTARLLGERAEVITTMG